MGRSRSSFDTSGPPDILLGPGNSFCIDYADPKRLLAGCNIPPGLRSTLESYTTDTSDSEWDSDLDAGASSASGYDDSDSDRDTRRRSRRRSSSDVKAADDTIIVRRDPQARAVDDAIVVRGGREERERVSKRYDSYLRRQPPRVTSLAFGSRVGDYAVIVSDKGQSYLGSLSEVAEGFMADHIAQMGTSSNGIGSVVGSSLICIETSLSSAPR